MQENEIKEHCKLFGLSRERDEGVDALGRDREGCGRGRSGAQFWMNMRIPRGNECYLCADHDVSL